MQKHRSRLLKSGDQQYKYTINQKPYDFFAKKLPSGIQHMNTITDFVDHVKDYIKNMFLVVLGHVENPRATFSQITLRVIRLIIL